MIISLFTINELQIKNSFICLFTINYNSWNCGGGDVSKAASIAYIPIWIFLGSEDPAVNPLYSLDMLNALTKAGAHPGFTQYPEVGHFSWLGVYSDPLMMEWLFRQHK
ncbi:MAG TPA: hypothetical protein VIJ75_20940 [Hanamia sp.]